MRSLVRIVVSVAGMYLLLAAFVFAPGILSAQSEVVSTSTCYSPDYHCAGDCPPEKPSCNLVEKASGKMTCECEK